MDSMVAFSLPQLKIDLFCGARNRTKDQLGVYESPMPP